MGWRVLKESVNIRWNDANFTHFKLALWEFFAIWSEKCLLIVATRTHEKFQLSNDGNNGAGDRGEKKKTSIKYKVHIKRWTAFLHIIIHLSWSSVAEWKMCACVCVCVRRCRCVFVNCCWVWRHAWAAMHPFFIASTMNRMQSTDSLTHSVSLRIVLEILCFSVDAVVVVVVVVRAGAYWKF